MIIFFDISHTPTYCTQAFSIVTAEWTVNSWILQPERVYPKRPYTLIGQLHRYVFHLLYDTATAVPNLYHSRIQQFCTCHSTNELANAQLPKRPPYLHAAQSLYCIGNTQSTLLNCWTPMAIVVSDNKLVYMLFQLGLQYEYVDISKREREKDHGSGCSASNNNRRKDHSVSRVGG